MNDKYLRVLEFPKILDMLRLYAVSDMGKEAAGELRPSGDMRRVEKLQAETEEALSVIAYTGGNPMSAFQDIREYLKLSQVGSMLSMKALLEVAQVLTCLRAVRRALVTEREDTPILTEMASAIATNRMLEEDILAAIISEEEMSDNASPELRDIRRHIRAVNDKVRDKLNAYLRSSAMQKYLSDTIVTVRNGRYVIPVKAEYRQYVPGLVHDQSGSGSTLFIEPMSVVEAGNELKELTLKERREIERILTEFTQRLAPDAPLIAQSIAVMAQLDVIFARAFLAREMKAVPPKLNQNGRIRLKQARHPLIDPDKVVPSDLWIGEDFTTLVITGPNTGGKTVTLKTVGLLTLMAQAGMQVPALFGSELAVFDEVFADIGDEQSIEQSLSTFSSHMTNIVAILKNRTKNSLVLFDELGAGTDPTEGAALAMSILEMLLREGVTTLATTHYSELKAFALSTPGVENASVEFDVNSLRPTYRLLIGVPGKSNAFEISRKLGLTEDIIQSASERLTRDQIRFEDVIANAEYHRQIAEKERKLAEEAHLETQRLRAEAEKARRELEGQRDEMIQKARAQAKSVLTKAQGEAERVISELKKARSAQVLKEHELHELRGVLQEGIDEVSDSIQPLSQAPGEKPKSLKAGDRVMLLRLGTQGTVLTPPDAKGDFSVQAGAIKLKANLSEVTLAAEKPPEDPRKHRYEPRRVPSTQISVSARRGEMECDLRGMTTEEAIAQMELFLDGARLNGIRSVSIIHGKGTGALRSAVQSALKRIPDVASFRLGRYGEGEDGVTIVTLK
ncbi:MAG: endonuclease MutS2 [Clostridia bacterium]|nr:endonuclease MutS2 [Clostridia bacterium]